MSQFKETFYGGTTKNGKSIVLVINGKDWNWKKSKFLTDTFSHLPIGTKFDIESTLEDRTLTVEWDTLVIHDEQITREECSWFDDYILSTACAKKNRSLASAKKKIDAENLGKLTINDLKHHVLTMSNAQRQALVAMVISELMY